MSRIGQSDSHCGDGKLKQFLARFFSLYSKRWNPTVPKKRSFLLLSLACALLPTGVNSAPVIATSDVVQVCEAGFGLKTTAESSSRKATCIAYLDAVIATALQIGTLASSDGKKSLFCLPEGIPYEDLAITFVRFSRANPRYDNRAAASVVLAAYADVYVCKK